MDIHLYKSDFKVISKDGISALYWECPTASYMREIPHPDALTIGAYNQMCLNIAQHYNAHRVYFEGTFLIKDNALSHDEYMELHKHKIEK